MSGSLPPFMSRPNVKDGQASVHSIINAVFSSWTDGLPWQRRETMIICSIDNNINNNSSNSNKQLLLACESFVQTREVRRLLGS